MWPSHDQSKYNKYPPVKGQTCIEQVLTNEPTTSKHNVNELKTAITKHDSKINWLIYLLKYKQTNACGYVWNWLFEVIWWKIDAHTMFNHQII